MDRIDILGYAASVGVLATFCMSTMVPLRVMRSVAMFCSRHLVYWLISIRFSFFTSFCFRLISYV